VNVFFQQMWGNVDWNAFRFGDPVTRVHSGPYSWMILPRASPRW
jgi:hypothetical protein